VGQRTRLAIGALLALAFASALLIATLGQMQVSCEVCVEFDGRRACREGAAEDREGAVRQAQSTACAILSRGITEGMRCDRTPPISVRCTE